MDSEGTPQVPFEELPFEEVPFEQLPLGELGIEELESRIQSEIGEEAIRIEVIVSVSW